jgi:glyoxylase I family protein
LRGVKDESTDNITYFWIALSRRFGNGPPASIAWYQKVFRATLAEGTLPHYGREWSGCAELLIESYTGVAVGLHNNNDADKAEEFDEARAGLDHISFQVQGREGLEAWGDWLDSPAAAHSGIRSKEEPFVYSTIVFRDLDKMQLEFVAIDV